MLALCTEHLSLMKSNEGKFARMTIKAEAHADYFILWFAWRYIS